MHVSMYVCTQYVHVSFDTDRYIGYLSKYPTPCECSQLINKRRHRDTVAKKAGSNPEPPRAPPLPLPPLTPDKVTVLTKAVKGVFERFSERDVAVAVGVCEALRCVVILGTEPCQQTQFL